MKHKNSIAIERRTPDVDQGLSAKEVEARRAAGLSNRVKTKTGKSYFRIVADNLFTYFNLIWLVIIAVLIGVRAPFKEFLFTGIILANTLLAIFQEVRAKRTVEKLSLLTAPRATVVRDGVQMEIAADAVVSDDIVILRSGNQIPADLVLLDGSVEVNESLLTGESDGVKKGEGDTLLAGSFIISGGCRAKAERVGAEAYVQKLAVKAKAFKATESYLFRDINRIIKIIGFLIIPFSVLMFFNNQSLYEIPEALRRTCASLVGMIPAGMFLLITVALSMGVVRLAMRKTMVKNPYSIEMLARTNVLCLDKTGTITDGTMRLSGTYELEPIEGESLDKVMASILAAQPDANFTSLALRQAYSTNAPIEASYNIPFSSKRKCTVTALCGLGTFALGAPEFLHVGALSEDVAARIKSAAEEGKRVLMLAYAKEEITEDALPEKMTPKALFFLEDHIREEAYDTIRWFKENGVAVKIISGDNPVTVASIAKRVGVARADKYVSLEGLSPEEAASYAEECTVFGRVTPEQKHALVVALKQKGYVVSMTGDGVNDTLALKEANCSIAMADGSDAARGLSNIVLLDNNFASLPSVVREGRQVVNNVERSSTLFLMKTFFALSLSLICILSGTAYPYLTTGMLLFEVFVDGIPSVILALQKNDKLIEGRFISGVLKRCLPSGILILLSVLSVILLRHFAFFTEAEYLTMCVLALTYSGFVALVALCLPFSKIRAACVAFSLVGTLALAIFGGGLVGVTVLNAKTILSTLAIVVLSVPVLLGLNKLFALLWGAIGRKKKKSA
ncbi:MAG: HAD-IC family P-type ATPase [Clostridia bacterium]|nr:HAD-IC family P-type ATPase [Clostridia bacterium]